MNAVLHLSLTSDRKGNGKRAKMGKLIYMDHAATTAVRPEVLDAMLPYFTEKFGNPSGVYTFASRNKDVINVARDIIADSLGAKPEEIYFTGGGSESDNWALKAVAEAFQDKGKHIITTRIEHHAILHTCQYLEKRGSVMAANNEIGTIEPISRIGAIAHEHGILFHTDAVQAYGQIPLDVNAMNIDMLSSSGHKLNGPKGIGFLYIRSGIKLGSFIHGGQQERGRRAGTENVPGIVGMGKAAELAMLSMEDRMKQETDIRDHIIHRILSEIPYSRLNGHDKDRLPNNVNVSFQFVEGETILIMLDMAGICASAGSACTSGSVDPSHVLTAIGLPKEISHGAVRLTLGYENTMDEADAVVDNLKRIVENLRKMSPAYQDFARRNM